MPNRDTAKQWFVTGAKPSQVQYHSLFDYLRFKDELIPLAGIENLVTILQGKLDVSVYEATVLALTVDEVPMSGNGSAVIPAGYLLEKVILLPSDDAPLKVGTTEGGEEVFPENMVNHSFGEVVVCELYAVNAARQIYISGMPAGSSYVTFKRKIKTVEP